MQKSTNEFAHQIASAIQGTPHLSGRILRYETHNGEVTLHGIVGSYFQKQMAQEAVRRIDGVRQVNNLLTVKWIDESAVTTTS